jgi:hypothetical protein
MPHQHHSTFFSNHHQHYYNNCLFLYNSILSRNLHYNSNSYTMTNDDTIILDIKGNFNTLYHINQYWYL